MQEYNWVDLKDNRNLTSPISFHESLKAITTNVSYTQIYK